MSRAKKNSKQKSRRRIYEMYTCLSIRGDKQRFPVLCYSSCCDIFAQTKGMKQQQQSAAANSASFILVQVLSVHPVHCTLTDILEKCVSSLSVFEWIACLSNFPKWKEVFFFTFFFLPASEKFYIWKHFS